MLSHNQLVAINGEEAVAELEAQREKRRVEDEALSAERATLLGKAVTEHSGTVSVDEARHVGDQARFNTSQQNAIDVTGVSQAKDTVQPGTSVFAAEGTPVLDGGVTVNPNATAPQPEVVVNPPKPQ